MGTPLRDLVSLRADKKPPSLLHSVVPTEDAHRSEHAGINDRPPGTAYSVSSPSSSSFRLLGAREGTQQRRSDVRSSRRPSPSSDVDSGWNFFRLTGSAGTAAAPKSSAYLVADSRYWLQAQERFDNSWNLVQAGAVDAPKDWIERLSDHANEPRVGIDARMIPHEKAMDLAQRGAVALPHHPPYKAKRLMIDRGTLYLK